MTFQIVNAINKPWPTTVEVHFNNVLFEDSQLLSPDNYTFNRGAYTINVELLNEKHVLLTVENLFEYENFTVFVSSNIKDMFEQSLSASNNSFTFDISRPNIDDSFQSISSANGRLKSGTVIVKATSDEDNWYLQTESGLDVVNKTTLRNEGFVLDGYGYNNIFVG